MRCLRLSISTAALLCLLGCDDKTTKALGLRPNSFINQPNLSTVIQVPGPTGVAATDTANITAALNSVPDAGVGYLVQLQAGTYVVTPGSTGSVIVTTSGTTLAGMGRGVTVVQLAPTSTSVTGVVRTQSGSTVNDVTFRDFTIDGNSANTTGGALVKGFYCGCTPDATCTNTNIAVINVDVKNTTDYCFDPHERTTNLTMIGNTAENCGTDCYTLDTIVGGVFTGNTCNGASRNGINTVYGTQSLSITGNSIVDAGAVGIYVQQSTEHLSIVGNDITNSGAQGAILNGTPNVSGNTFTQPGTDINFIGNRISNSQSQCVQLIGMSGANVGFNRCRDSNLADGGSSAFHADEVFAPFDAGTEGGIGWYSTGNVFANNTVDITPTDAGGAGNLVKYCFLETSSSDNGNTYNGNVCGTGSIVPYTNAAYSVLAATLPYQQTSPSQRSMAEWNFDPITFQSTSQVLTTGTFYLMSYVAQANRYISSVDVYVGTLGSSLTASANYLGVYSISGTTATLISATADQTNAWEASGGGTTGWKTVALTTGFTEVAGQMYAIAAESTGTTPVSLARGPSSAGVANAALSTSSSSFYRFANFADAGSGGLPASMPLSGQVTSGAALTILAGVQ